MMQPLRLRWRSITVLAVALLGLTGLAGAVARGVQPGDRIEFEMVPSASAEEAGCLADARAHVTVETVGANQHMTVNIEGAPADTGFVLFVIQVPNFPFGMSWYQGDVDTGPDGTGSETFIGRFNEETFVVAPDTAPAPVVHDTDADSNPATGPVHTFHLGLWFDVVDDAVNAGCGDATTPFNGDHTAGIQALSTRNYPDEEGPLRQLAA
jgi:hypothetical protein